MSLFGERLREAREKRGLLQRELSKKSGVSEGMISQYERGMHEPNLFTLTLLVDALEISTDFLLGRDDYDTGRIKKTNFRV